MGKKVMEFVYGHQELIYTHNSPCIPLSPHGFNLKSPYSLLLKMLPKAESIFHLGGEEAGEAEREFDYSVQPSESLVGLRILIENPKQEANIIIKPALKPFSATSFPHQTPQLSPEFGFLKACRLCKRKLSPLKDVYMYRGDQGFCSIDCRCRQIMLDERRELEASSREQVEVPRHHRAGAKVRQLDPRKNISLAA